ncbi:hypothetical protein AJ79_07116 [Helicocarpus griseus UAMH5409]|uniref:Uncharacterized protein n=1 Tax=Helicocarpus griseus UAMH5409 TaxID=1447875 RepID=A0A2B7X5J8_9EURO|nr:hypothetical protein AJ79_07116 [Helicocarpus griseus UAMH5409]
MIDGTYAKPETFPISREDTLVAIWEQHYRKKVHSVLKDTLRQSINVFNRGPGLTIDECPKTLVVHVWDANNEYWWARIVPALEEACERKLQVEILQAEELFSSEADTTMIDELGPNLSLGARCGVEGGLSSGTLGPYLKLNSLMGV